MEYRTLKVSPELVQELSRALWLAERRNEAEGIRASKPECRQHDALARIVREWSGVAIFETPTDARFDALCHADWRCEGCGASGLNAGGLTVTGTGVVCAKCGG